MVIEGPGMQVKGIIELDGSREVVAAHFPVFSLAEGDKATFKADRAPRRRLARDHAWGRP